MLDFAKVLLLVLVVREVLQLEIKVDEKLFRVSLIRWINDSTLEIRWVLNPSLVDQCQHFIFTLSGSNDHDNIKTYPKTSRYGVIYNVSNDFEELSAMATFSGTSPIVYHIELPIKKQKYFVALCSRDEEMFGCFDEICHKIKLLFTTKSIIRGLAFGNLQSQLYVLTKEELIYFDLDSNMSTVNKLIIPSDIVAFRYDRLNQILNIGTAEKIYYLTVGNNTHIYETKLPRGSRLLDMVDDPLNGYLHAILKDGQTHFYSKIQPIVLKNKTLTSVELGKFPIPGALSMALSNYSSKVYILTLDKLISFSLSNIALESVPIQKNISFNISFKLETQNHGFTAWIPNNLYHLELNEYKKYGVNDISSNFSLYTNVYSAKIGAPVPALSPKISDGFFGMNFVIIRWKQPYHSWTSKTRWNNWNYTIELLYNNSIIYKTTFNKQFIYEYHKLGDNKQYLVRVSIGPYSDSISGRTLSDEIGSTVKFFMCTEKSVDMFEYSIKTLAVVKRTSLFKPSYPLQRIVLFNDGSFIHLKNGSIYKGPNIEQMQNVSQWKQFSGVNAKKMEIDSMFGNIFYIEKRDDKVYRIRQTGDSKFQIDKIINTSVNDIVLFVTQKIIVFTNTSGIFHCSLNGQSHKPNLPSEVVSYSYAQNIALLGLGGIHRIISYNNCDIRWKILNFGVSNFENGTVSLTSFNGNGTLILWRNETDILDVFDLENGNYAEISLMPIQNDSIVIRRTVDNRIIVSWEDSKNEGKINYHITLTNQKKTLPMFTNETFVELKNNLNCSQMIRVTAKPCNEGTCAESMARLLRIPCTTAPPRILSIFYINKVSRNPRKDRIEFFARILMYTNTKIVDGQFQCFMKIYWTKNDKRKLLRSTNISCLEEIIEINLLVDTVDKFFWDNICLVVGILDEEVTKCDSLEHWKSTLNEIYFARNQTLITTFINESILKICIGDSRNSVYIGLTNGTNRTILKTEGYINDLEIDWKRNTLFWIQRNGFSYSLYSVYLGGNKKDLSEDKLMWYKSRNDTIKSDINSIERNIFIESINTKESYQYNLDSGPGWSNQSLTQCYSLIRNRNSLKCTKDALMANDSSLKLYYITARKVLVLMIEADSLCKIINIDNNYYLPNDINNCLQIYNVREAAGEYPLVTFNDKGHNFFAMDEQGKCYRDPLHTTTQCSTKIRGLNINSSFVCLRHTALISISSNNAFSDYLVDIRWQEIGSNIWTRIDLLDHRIVNGKEHKITLVNLYPATTYIFMVAVSSSSLSNLSIISATCSCKTQDDIPSSPDNITVVSLNETYFKITWNIGRTNGKNLSSFIIKRNDDVLYQTTVPEFYLSKNKSENVFVSIASKNAIGKSDFVKQNIIYLETGRSISLSQDIYLSQLMRPYLMVVFVGVFLISLLIILLVYLRRRKLHQLSQHRLGVLKYQPIEMAMVDRSISYDINCLYSSDPLPLSEFDKIPHIPQSSLTMGHLIGNGAFGMVFKGTMKIETDIDKVVCESVALKMRHGKSLSEEDFKREAVLLFKYSCPYIIRIYGVSFDSPEKQCIILEYMEKGNLRQYLRHHRPDSMTSKRTDINKGNEKSKKCLTLSFMDFYEIASDILEAMKFLEQKKFVHRDLAARNCLVSHKHKKGRITKLGDFGLARDIYSDEYYRKVSETKMPIRWMSPETIKDGVFSGKSDIWSFGVLLWEIMSLGMDPYMGQSNSDVVKDVIAGKHLEKPEDCSYELYEIMLQCWKYYPEQRPNFTEIDLIFHRLDELKDSEDFSFSNRLIIRSYVSTDSSNIDVDDGNNSERLTEKSFLTLSDKYFEAATQPLKAEATNIQTEYDNLGYAVPIRRSRMVSTTTEQTNLDDDNDNIVLEA